MRILVTSENDPASLNIKEVLIDEHGFNITKDTFDGNPIYSLNTKTKLIITNRDLIYCDHLEEAFNPDVFIFCSRHRAVSGKPALLVHSTGNFGSDASFGGNPFSLSVSTPSLVSAALKRLMVERNNRGLEEFDVTLEVTHHGPTMMNTPLLFIELGSDENYWIHKEGARAVAAAAMECVRIPFKKTSVIGFGGTHYASKFNKLVLERDAVIGHIAPKYALDNIDPSVVSQMISRTQSRVELALVDWKGTNIEQKEHLFPILEELGIEVIKARAF